MFGNIRGDKTLKVQIMPTFSLTLLRHNDLLDSEQ